MSEIADRYRRSAAGFTEVVESVPADAWSNPAPCEGWVAVDVVEHVVSATRSFFLSAGCPLPEGPTVADDPVAAWSAARDAAQTALADPAVAGTEYSGYFGPTTVETSIDNFMVPDNVIHTWDLGTAVGRDVRLDPELVDIVDGKLRPMGDAGRTSGVFGPEVFPPDDADAQTRLLAFTGRKAF